MHNGKCIGFLFLLFSNIDYVLFFLVVFFVYFIIIILNINQSRDINLYSDSFFLFFAEGRFCIVRPAVHPYVCPSDFDWNITLKYFSYKRKTSNVVLSH